MNSTNKNVINFFIIILGLLPYILPFSGMCVFNDKLPNIGDLRAHILRIYMFKTYFIDYSDYNPSWYFGGKFLSVYGWFYFLIGYVIYFTINLFLHNPITSAIYSIKILLFITQVILIYLIIYILVNFFKTDTTFACIIASISQLFSPLIILYQTGAYPYIFSLEMNLISLIFLLKWFSNKNNIKYLIYCSIFTSLSIFSHTYGYINNFIILVSVIIYLIVLKSNEKIKNIVLITLFLLIIPLIITIHRTLSIIQYLSLSSPLIEIKKFTYSIIVLYIIFYTIFTYKYKYEILKLNPNYELFIIYIIFILTLIFSFVTILLLKFEFYKINIIKYLLIWRFVLINCTIFSLIILSSVLYKYCKYKTIFVILLINLIILSQFLNSIKLSQLMYIKKLYLNNVLFNYYEPPYKIYNETLINEIKGKKILVSDFALGTTNSLVTFCPFYNCSTVSGPYNQGDPIFFKLTVFYEWENKLLFYPTTLENIMYLTGAKIIVTGSSLIGIKANQINNALKYKYKIISEGVIVEENKKYFKIYMTGKYLQVKLIPKNKKYFNLCKYDGILFGVKLNNIDSFVTNLAIDVEFEDKYNNVYWYRLLTSGKDNKYYEYKNNIWINISVPFFMLINKTISNKLDLCNITEIRIILFLYDDQKPSKNIVVQINKNIYLVKLNFELMDKIKIRYNKKYKDIYILKFNGNVSNFYIVKPILIISNNETLAWKLSLFVNLFSKNGYKYVFTTNKYIPCKYLSGIIIIGNNSNKISCNLPTIKILNSDKFSYDSKNNIVYLPFSEIWQNIPYDPGNFKTYSKDNTIPYPAKIFDLSYKLNNILYSTLNYSIIDSINSYYIKRNKDEIVIYNVTGKMYNSLILAKYAYINNIKCNNCKIHIYKDVYGFLLLNIL